MIFLKSKNTIDISLTSMTKALTIFDMIYCGHNVAKSSVKHLLTSLMLNEFLSIDFGIWSFLHLDLGRGISLIILMVRS